MSDITSLIKARILDQVPELEAVAIASNLGAAVMAANLLPAAYVIRSARSAEGNTIETGGFSQSITESVSVLLIDRVTGDVSGEVTSLLLEEISQAVITALMGWEPDSDHDPVEYTGGSLAEWTEPALMLWLDDFTTVSYREIL
jgi:hypothetical protein